MPLKPALNVRFKSILFATDFSFESERAMRHAAALARHYKAKLHIAHVVSSLGLTLAGPEAIATAHDVATRDLRSVEQTLEAKGLLAAVEHDTLVCEGQVWSELVRVADELEADLIVIGTHGRRGLGRLLLGSVAEEIIRRAECPVLTVGPDFKPSGVENVRQPRPLILATDFKAASLLAIPCATNFAAERGVPLVLMHVIPLLPKRSEGEWYTSESLQDRRRQVEQEAIRNLQAIARNWSASNSQIECIVRCGEPADEILKMATELQADAIALGLHHSEHPQAISHFRATTAYEVICRARCAVLTVRD